VFGKEAGEIELGQNVKDFVYKTYVSAKQWIEQMHYLGQNPCE
jgi:hypothetical protein